MGGSGGIASLFAMGMSSSFINSFASAAAVRRCRVDCRVRWRRDGGSNWCSWFVCCYTGRRCYTAVASSAFWMVCGLWMGEWRGLWMAAAGDMSSAEAILWRAAAVASLCLLWRLQRYMVLSLCCCFDYRCLRLCFMREERFKREKKLWISHHEKMLLPT